MNVGGGHAVRSGCCVAAIFLMLPEVLAQEITGPRHRASTVCHQRTPNAWVETGHPHVPVFTNATVAARVNFEHQIAGVASTDPENIVAGIAAGDYDGDGYIDLFAAGGNDSTPDLLFRNRADGTVSFDEIGAQAGISQDSTRSAGPVFADIDGDGDLDLLVGAVDFDPIAVYINQGNGNFSFGGADSGLDRVTRRNSFSPALADVDRDGDLDLALSHWHWDGSFEPHDPMASTETLFSNDGAGRFTDASTAAGLTAAIGADGLDFSFTPNFADINDDGWPDLLLASDFGTSQSFMNDGTGGFIDTTAEVISDRNGMGASVGDYDNDGDLDWFVTAIASEDVDNAGFDGNRLYRNDGRGQFTDVTDEAGVRIGGWGWGSCFADFNNDGHLDLFHVNGWSDERFATLPSKLFLADGAGSFVESARAARIFSDRQGRGLVCADFDRDGDVDLLIANNQNYAELYRNDLDTANGWLTVVLRDDSANTHGIGARVWVETSAGIQMREIQAGSHFVSSDPSEAHFGLGQQEVVSLSVRWPDREVSEIKGVLAGTHLQIARSKSSPRVLVWRRVFSAAGCD